jgi:hypothetical protein
MPSGHTIYMIKDKYIIFCMLGFSSYQLSETKCSIMKVRVRGFVL